MLRWVIALLVLANAGYFFWTQGHLAPLGLAPAVEREPERLQSQIRPEAQRLLNAPREAATPEPAKPEAPPAGTMPPASPPEPPAVAPEPLAPTAPALADAEPARACWEAGAFTEAQADRLRAALSALGLPASGWQLVESRSSGRWLVYMGRFDNAEQLERKRAELRALNVDFRTVSAPGLAPGLALGTFSTEAAAQQGLQKAVRDGVRTARVAQERAESLSFTLRLPSINEAQRGAIDGLGESMAGKRLQRCN
jgi:cell division protein FtsN